MAASRFFGSVPPHTLSPGAALAVLTLGVLLIFVELNRPGRILPGALGLLLTLLAIARLRPAFTIGSAALLASAGLLLLIGLRRRLPAIVQGAAGLALVAGFYAVAAQGPGGRTPQRIAAVLCGCILAGSSLVLSAVARRARRNKGLD